MVDSFILAYCIFHPSVASNTNIRKYSSKQQNAKLYLIFPDIFLIVIIIIPILGLRKGSINEALRQAKVLEVVNLATGSSVRVPTTSVRTLWRHRPPPKPKRRLPKAKQPEMYERRPLSEILPAPPKATRDK
jgi:hypothetical protein